MLVLVTPTDSLEADCVTVALNRTGVAATTSPGPDIGAVVLIASPGWFVDSGHARADDPDAPPLLVISPVVDDASQRLAHDLGAARLLGGETTTQRLADTIEHVVQAGTGSRVAAPADPSDVLRNLTGREREVVGLLGMGASNTDIASALDISYHTARTHVAHVLAKLGVTHRYAAVALARAGQRLTPATVARGGSP